jgi:GDPmannose 4,6-dehydratase
LPTFFYNSFILIDHLISISTIKTKLKYEVDSDRLRPIDADLQVPNTDKFIKHTGWKPIFSFEQTMYDLLEYWRNRVEEYGNVFLQR